MRNDINFIAFPSPSIRAMLARAGFGIAMAVLLWGCAGGPSHRLQQMAADGEARGFALISFGDAPPLIGLLRDAGSDDTLWVVIEGDGLAWLSAREPSIDPTPLDAVGWRLANHLSQNKVLYLARPCQFLGPSQRRACVPEDWTGGRFARKWVERLNQAVDESGRRTSARRVVLGGYSGGGTLAALLALKRTDVAGLVTVAAPLDHIAWTRLHGVSELAFSLNPADSRVQLARLPQLHLVGSRDEVVPPALTEDFLAAYPPASPVSLQRVDAGHGMAVDIDLGLVVFPALMN